MKINLWKSLYTNQIYETPVDWIPHQGGWELVCTLERNSKEEKNENNKLKDFEYWIQQPYEYLQDREEIINVLSIVKDDFEYVCDLYDDLENIYNEIGAIAYYKEKQITLIYLDKELNFAFDAISEVETYSKAPYFSENIDYINQLLDCAITKIRGVYNTIKAGV